MVEEGYRCVGEVGFGGGIEWKTTQRNECHKLEGSGNVGCIDYQDVLS